jgi:putative transposase
MWSGVRAYRRKVLVGPIETRLKQIISEVCAEHQAEIEELEVMPAHVRLLVTVDPQFGIHRLAKLIKGRSARFLRQEFPVLKRKLPSLWTHSYFVSTTGGAPLCIIKQYSEHQKHV